MDKQLKPKAGTKNEFVFGNIRIDQGVNKTKNEFYKFYKGKANVDIDTAWVKYQAFKKNYK